jgi:VIT1/CCC1 family predicted Fe2+/Mn2+ transporter
MNRPHVPESRAVPDVLRHYVGDIVYGANDGLITTFTVVSGVSGAMLPPRIVVILGVVNLVADGFSMGASNFLSIRAAAAAEGASRGIREPLAHAGTTFLAFLAVGALPLASFLAPAAAGDPFWPSAALTGLALFVVGAGRGWLTRKRWIRSGLEMLAVGAIASGVAYAAGTLLGRWVAE